MTWLTRPERQSNFLKVPISLDSSVFRIFLSLRQAIRPDAPMAVECALASDSQEFSMPPTDRALASATFLAESGGFVHWPNTFLPLRFIETFIDSRSRFPMPDFPQYEFAFIFPSCGFGGQNSSAPR
jgi:hypothetical protein